jgi:hypothetical protein
LNSLYLQKLGYGEFHESISEPAIARFLERAPDYTQALASHRQDRNTAILAALDALLERAEKTGRIVQHGEMGDEED